MAKKKPGKYQCKRRNFTNGHMFQVGQIVSENDVNNKVALERHFEPIKSFEEFVQPKVEDLGEEEK